MFYISRTMREGFKVDSHLTSFRYSQSQKFSSFFLCVLYWIEFFKRISSRNFECILDCADKNIFENDKKM